MLRTSGLAAAAAAAAVAVGVPLAMAAPTSAPPSDTGGYLDSTARCTAPDAPVLFGATKTSRVAICKTASGYEYRGVRINDGAKLIATAKQTSPNSYAVQTDGVTYTVTPTALSITANGNTFRTETWLDFHGTQVPAAATAKPSTAATPGLKTGPSAAPQAAPAAPAATAPSAAAAAPKAPAPTTSGAPPPPPLAAEVGGPSSAG
jgi:hypothetical protein